jgi:hypothetical protein
MRKDVNNTRDTQMSGATIRLIFGILIGQWIGSFSFHIGGILDTHTGRKEFRWIFLWLGLSIYGIACLNPYRIRNGINIVY